MQISPKTKLSILFAVTVVAAGLYLVIGIDFDIFQYQFSSRLRKLILMILVGAAIAASVVIFQAITSYISEIKDIARTILLESREK